MKKGIFKILKALALGAAALAWASCSNIAGNEDESTSADSDGKIAVAFSFSPSFRSILPSVTLSSYTYTITAKNTTSGEETTLASKQTLSDCALTASVAAGTYTFTATAYSDDTEVLTGTSEATQISSTNKSVSITLKGSTGSTGTVSVTLKIEDGLGVAYVMTGLFDDYAESTYKNAVELTADTTTNPGYTTVTYESNSVPSGVSKHLVFFFYDTNGKLMDADYAETVYVVAGGTSSKTITLTAENFVLKKVSSVTITGSTTIEATAETTLTAAATMEGTLGNAEISSYSWEIASGLDYATLSATTGESVTLTGTNSTSSDQTVTVTVTATDSNGKTAMGTKTVTVAAAGTTVAAKETLTWDFSTGAVTMYTDSDLSTEDSDSTIQYSSGTATAYLKGSSSGSSTASMKVETPVSGAKIAIRNTSENQDAQVNAGSVLYIPVSSGSVVTVTQRGAGDYELGGVESLTYTALTDGYVVYDVISSHYLSSIVVTDVVVSDDHTSDVVQFAQKTDSSTANTEDVLGFTATDVSSSDESVATADLTSNSGYITITSKAAGTATITATGSGSETTSWTVTVRRYGNIVVGGITPYTSAQSVESSWLKVANPGTGESDTVTVQAGRVTASAGKFIYLNKQFATSTKVRIEATTFSYTNGAKTLDVGFIGTPANVLSDSGIYTTAGGANSGKAAGQSTNGWNGALTGSSPYTYICEYTFGSSSVTSSHYLYDSATDTSKSSTYYYKKDVTPKAFVSSGYAVFGDTTNEVTFTLIEVYADDTLVYSSATSETASTAVSSGFSFSFLTGDADISVSCTDNGSNSYTFTATPPSSSAAYTYAWYVDLAAQSETTSTLTTTISTTEKPVAVLVTATDSETGVTYSAQYTLTVE